MKVKIIRIGNSRGIIIPNHILKESGLDEGVSLDLSMSDGNKSILLQTAIHEAESLGLDGDERRKIQEFIDIYSSIFNKLC